MMDNIKQLLTDFFNEEYDEQDTVDTFDTNYPDITNIGVAYTTTPKEDHEIQVSLDLENLQLNTFVDDILIETHQYNSLDGLKEEIPYWVFSELVSIDEVLLKEKTGLEVDDNGDYFIPKIKL